MKLEKMTDDNFKVYLNQAIPDYADDKIKAGTWNESEAMVLAEESYNNLLPKGADTPDNFFIFRDGIKRARASRHDMG